MFDNQTRRNRIPRLILPSIVLLGLFISLMVGTGFANNQRSLNSTPLSRNATYFVELTQAIQDMTGKGLNQGIETEHIRETWQFETTGPPVQFDNTGYTVNEGDVATVTVTLQSPSPNPVMVGYRTVAIPGEAVPGVDYETVSATLTFAPFVTSQTLTVTTLPNAIVDGQKNVGLELLAPVGAALGVPSEALLSIFDDEALTVRFQNATYSDDEGDGLATIEVILSPESTQQVTIKFSTQDGTATTGEDYTAVVDQEIFFAPGETSKAVQVSILEDDLNELDETVNLVLFEPLPADTLIVNNPATLIVRDNDPEPSVTFSSDKYSVDEAGEKVTLEVELSTLSGREVTVKYETGGGTATPGVDYEHTVDTVTFAKGDPVQSIDVNIIDDQLPDEGETFNVGLSDPAGAALGALTFTEVTISDQDSPGVFLPVVGNRYITHFEGFWEVEDNDIYQNANGPLRSGQEYFGRPDDEQDFFTIAVERPGKINIELLDHSGERVQLQLYYQSVEGKDPVAIDLSEDDNDYQIMYPIEAGAAAVPGLYYVWIYTDAGRNSQPYTLTVNYPMQ